MITGMVQLRILQKVSILHPALSEVVARATAPACSNR